MGDVQPQDEGSGLVKAEWVPRVRPDGKRRRASPGDLRRWTLEGEQVEATWLDRHGGPHRVAGTVSRNAARELVVVCEADGMRQETPVPRDANVDVLPRQQTRPAAERGR